jgi:hypothetical protein
MKIHQDDDKIVNSRKQRLAGLEYADLLEESIDIKS